MSLFLGFTAIAWYALQDSAWYIWLMLAALAAAVCFIRNPAAPGNAEKRFRGLLWALIAYVAFQLAPLPPALLSILSPARGELSRAVASVAPGASYAPLSVHTAHGWEHLLRLAAYALVFLTVCALFKRCRSGPIVFPILMVAFLEASIGITQYALDPSMERAHGTLVNPDHYSAFLEMALPLAAMFSALNIARWRTAPETARLGYTVRAAVGAILALMLLVAIALALSRIGLVAALAGLCMCGTLLLPRKWPATARVAIACGLLAFSAFSIFALAPARLASRFSALSPNREVVDTIRVGVWKDTLHLIAAYPAFGSGLGTYGSAFVKYQNSDLEQAVIYAHNDYLQLTAELGAIGVAILAALAVWLLILLARAIYGGARRQDRYLAVACAGALTAIAIHSFFDFNLYIGPVGILMAWVAGVGASLGLEAKRSAREEKIAAPRAVPGLSIALISLLAVYSTVAIFSSKRLGGNPALERVLSGVGLCADDQVAAAAYQKLSKPAERNAALADFDRLLVRDPTSAFAWCDLAQAFLVTGHADKAGVCLHRAQELAPNHPVVLLRLANFYVNLGQRNTALREGARIMSIAPGFNNAVFQLQSNIQASAAEVIGAGTFPGCTAARSYFLHVANSANRSQVPLVWSWMASNKCPDEATVSAFVEFLMEHNQYAEASAAWTAYEGYDPENHLFNGGFERVPVKSPFDWLLKDPGRVNVVEAVPQAREGTGVLRMQYAKSVAPPTDPASQLVYLTPGRYRFEAEVHLQDFQLDHGVAFRIIDRSAPAHFKTESQPLTGTLPWQKVALHFPVSGKPRLFEVQVVQMKVGIVSDSDLTGTAWIDNAKLVRE